MKYLLRLFLLYPSALIVIFGGFLTYSTTNAKLGTPHITRQNIDTVSKKKSVLFAAIPLSSLEIKSAVASEDARPIIIERYMRHYNSPMISYTHTLVQKADQYGVDPYLIVAIAQQESNLGKITPPACHNAWGWGIHSKGTLCFDDWEKGIDTFAKGISEKYLAYGLRTPEEIMSKYVPHSPEGAWARGVNQFLNALHSGKW